MTPIWLHRTHPVFARVEAFISNRIFGDDRQMPGNTILAVADGDKLAGALLYHGYDPEYGIVEISGAADDSRFLTRRVLWEMYDYPFNQLGCQTVMQVTEESDERQRRMLESYGFTRHVLPRLRGRNRNAAIYLLHDDVWRANGYHKENAHG